jgi:hypothetical protein
MQRSESYQRIDMYGFSVFMLCKSGANRWTLSNYFIFSRIKVRNERSI